MRPRLVEGGQSEPPYPADTRANGWRPEVDLERICQSRTWLLCPPDYRPWLLLLWLESWRSVPCGTWPSDDELIAARIGLAPAQFAVHRVALMRGWRLHSDGLLYHEYITGQVLAMISRRVSNAERQARFKGANKGRHEDSVTRYSRVTNGYSRVSNGEDQDQDQEKKETSLREAKKVPASPTAPRSPQLGSRLPQDWVCPPDWLAWAETHGLNGHASAEAERFRDYWVAVPGQRGRKADWLATWRNWCRRSLDGKPSPPKPDFSGI